ncbi:MAG: hypothetical protein JST68_25690 [Bacteroidetes bacterium]|nr:hypothetical protein [Bacteroidota bacterium]
MKQIFFPVVLLLLAGTGFYCKPTHLGTRLTGKLVEKGPCGQYVIEVISGKIDSSKLEKSWRSGKDSTYENVFAVENVCDFGGAGFKVNDVFTFAISDKKAPQNCVLCQVYFAVPAVKNTVVDVRK